MDYPEKVIKTVNTVLSREYGYEIDIVSRCRKQEYADGRKIASKIIYDHLASMSKVNKHRVISEALKRDRATIYNQLKKIDDIMMFDKNLRRLYEEVKKSTETYGVDNILDYLWLTIDDINKRINRLKSEKLETFKKIAEHKAIIKSHAGAPDTSRVLVPEEVQLR